MMALLLNKLNKHKTMNKYLILTLILFINIISGQKKEIKKAEKLFESGDVKGASDLLVNNEKSI